MVARWTYESMILYELLVAVGSTPEVSVKISPNESLHVRCPWMIMPVMESHLFERRRMCG